MRRAGLFFSMTRTDNTHRERNGPVMHKPNMLLESDVQDELDRDPQIDDTRVVVKADAGRVTLSGSVPSYYQAMRAADDTLVVGGVTGVDNQVLVGLVGDAITDAEIAARTQTRSTPTSSRRRAR